MEKFKTNVASVGSVFNATRNVKVLSLPETTKEKSTFRAKALRRELVLLITSDEKPSLETSIFPLSFQVVRTFTFRVSWKNLNSILRNLSTC